MYSLNKKKYELMLSSRRHAGLDPESSPGQAPATFSLA